MKTIASVNAIGAVMVTPPITQPSSYLPGVTTAAGLAANLRGATQVGSEDHCAPWQSSVNRADRTDLNNRIHLQFTPVYRSASAISAKFRPMGSPGEPPVLVPS